MKILLTGASGFVGKHVFRKLTNLGHKVTCVALKTTKLNNQKVIALNLANKSKVSEFLRHRQFDCIVHLAALVPKDFSKPEANLALRQNYLSTLNLLEEFARGDAKTFVHASSISVLEPDNFYSLGKLQEESLGQLFAQKTGKNVVSLRITSPYGPGQNIQTVIALFIEQALDNKPLHIFGSGRREQDFVHVFDIANAFAAAVNAKKSSIYNVGSGQTVNMLTLGKLILSETKSKSKIIYIKNDPQENFRIKVNIDNTRRDLHYRPMMLKKGIHRFTEYLRNTK